MKSYLVDDVDLASGKLVKREVDSAWLHQELLASAERIRSGTTGNLDMYDANRNPSGAFIHPDVQTVFYELTGAPRSYASIDEKHLAILSAADALEADYA